jgi:hypothetical protein
LLEPLDTRGQLALDVTQTLGEAGGGLQEIVRAVAGLRAGLPLLFETVNGAVHALVDLTDRRLEVLLELAQPPLDLGAELVDLVLARAERRHRLLDLVQLLLGNLEDSSAQVQALVQLGLCLRSVCVRAVGPLAQLFQLAAR